MAAIQGANVVAYSIAAEIVKDMIVDIKDHIDDEIDEDSDTDTDGISIIVRPAVTSAQTGQKGDDSNDSSDDTDKYIDTVTSRSDDTTVDEEGKDVFVDAEEEASLENLRGATLTMETIEEMEVDEAVRETLNRVVELLLSEEVASFHQPSSVGSVSLVDNTGIIPDQYTIVAETITMETNKSPGNVIHTDNPGLTELEDLDGEIEFYDSYAVFTPYDGGPNVVCATDTNYAPDMTVGTASEMYSEGSYQTSDAIAVPFSPQDYANAHTTHRAGFQSPLANYTDASHFYPLTNDFPENPVQNLGDTSRVPCRSPNGLVNQFSIVDDGRTLHVRPRRSDSDMANTKEFRDYYESPYDGQHGDAETSDQPCDNPSETTEAWYDSPTSVDKVDTCQPADTGSGEERVVPIGVRESGTTVTGDSPDPPYNMDIRTHVDTGPTSTNDIYPLFPKSSLNPECEPFVPTQNYDTHYTAYSNGDSPYPTTEPHPGTLSYGGPPHLPLHNPDPRDSNNLQGQTYMFPAYPCTGYFMEQRPIVGQSPHHAYPVYPRNVAALNSNFYDTQPSFQQTDPQFGFSNQHLQFPITPNGNQSTDFRYPAIYVSEAGLITVLLRHDFSVEMTVDQVIRVVNHKKKLVALVNSQGTDSYVFHPAARITQDLEALEVEVFLQRKVKMTTEQTIFANNFKCYKFDHEDIEEAEPEFSDLRNDLSVDFLFSSRSDSDMITQRATGLAEEAQVEHGANGWSVVRINGVKIIQNERGEVTVNSGPKFIRMYPNNMSLQLKSNFLEVRIGINWSVKVSRGSHVLNASHCGFIVTNGRIEAGFDDANKPFACLLPRRVPLLNDHRKLRRRHGTGTHIRHRSRTEEVD